MAHENSQSSHFPIQDSVYMSGWSSTLLAMCSLDSVSRICTTVSALKLRHDRQPNLLRRFIGLTSGQSGVREYWACLLYRCQMDLLVSRITRYHPSSQSVAILPCNRVVGFEKREHCSRDQKGGSDVIMSPAVV